MFSRLRWFKNLFHDLPRQIRLAYCLVRDPRRPIAPNPGGLPVLALAARPRLAPPPACPARGAPVRPPPPPPPAPRPPPAAQPPGGGSSGPRRGAGAPRRVSC